MSLPQRSRTRRDLCKKRVPQVAMRTCTEANSGHNAANVTMNTIGSLKAKSLHNRTRFPLVGAHTAVACFRCHPGAPVGNLSRAPVQCEACHQQDLVRATTPDHAAQGWTQDCDQCHKPVTWTGAGFIPASSRLPARTPRLPARHVTATVSFLDCRMPVRHAIWTTSNCDYQPNHMAANFSTNCQPVTTPSRGRGRVSITPASTMIAFNAIFPITIPLRHRITLRLDIPPIAKAATTQTAGRAPCSTTRFASIPAHISRSIARNATKCQRTTAPSHVPIATSTVSPRPTTNTTT